MSMMILCPRVSNTYNLDLVQCQLFGIQTLELIGSVLLAGYEGSHGELLSLLKSTTDRWKWVETRDTRAKDDKG